MTKFKLLLLFTTSHTYFFSSKTACNKDFGLEIPKCYLCQEISNHILTKMHFTAAIRVVCSDHKAVEMHTM